MHNTINFRLANQYAQIDFLLRGLDNDFLKYNHVPKKWSIHENLAHLGRYHDVFIDRIEAIISEDNPVFERYVAENDKDFALWLELETPEIITNTKQIRKHLAEFMVGLSGAQLTLSGTHPKFGKMDLTDWTEFFLLHESHHLFTIFKIVQENKI